MKKSIGTSVICIVFAILFGIGGAVAIGGLFNHLSGWLDTRNWVPAMAEVLDTKLEQSKASKPNALRVTALYRYSADSKSYTGTRVGLQDSFDSVGEWHQAHHDSLKEAMRAGQRVAIWIDPARPENAVIDRDLRWNMIAFLTLFATLSPAISIGALWYLFRGTNPGDARGKSRKKTKANSAKKVR